MREDKRQSVIDVNSVARAKKDDVSTDRATLPLPPKELVSTRALPILVYTITYRPPPLLDVLLTAFLRKVAA